ncbi:hypothetical protein GCM10022225_69530 [Plantactinospora mayteni]|uniref:Uncharacterized protein n=1 Tax=Plantactinospora mayteni TaxID=566021 RepID=A0ABQ4EVX1_9ACTN|nr:hypothetical protein [Plantactinospora mayteni]GIG98812.1 hypothetical protein Pma05_53850 [Plantactinospora mayteni]
MSEFAELFVSHHQFLVVTAPGDTELPLYTVGDELVHLVGNGGLTVMTGPHTGYVAARVTVLAQPPDEAGDAGWDAATEATLWCPEGRMTVYGLMGDAPDGLRSIAVLPDPGLLRVRVRARDRRPDHVPAAPTAPPEQYEVLVWPVHEDIGIRTLHGDDLPSTGWTPKPDSAAGWAMVHLVSSANPDPQTANLRAAAARARGVDPDEAQGRGRVAERRVDVRREFRTAIGPAAALLGRPADCFGAVPDAAELVLPAGALEIRLGPGRGGPDPADGYTATWRWTVAPGATAVVPDAEPSTVELRLRPDPVDGTAARLTATHRAVRAQDAVLLGLVWDYLMHRAGLLVDGVEPGPHPWQESITSADLVVDNTVCGTNERDREHEWSCGDPALNPARRVTTDGVGDA